jgi:hypothetical protein
MDEDQVRITASPKEQALLNALRHLGILGADKQPDGAGEDRLAPSASLPAEGATKRVGTGSPEGPGACEQRAIENPGARPPVKLTPKQNELISLALCQRAVEITPALAPENLKVLRCALVEALLEVTRQTAVPRESREVNFPSIVG